MSCWKDFNAFHNFTACYDMDSAHEQRLYIHCYKTSMKRIHYEHCTCSVCVRRCSRPHKSYMECYDQVDDASFISIWAPSQLLANLLHFSPLCIWQIGKRFQQPTATSPKQYERAQYMLDRLGLSVRLLAHRPFLPDMHYSTSLMLASCTARKNTQVLVLAACSVWRCIIDCCCCPAAGYAFYQSLLHGEDRLCHDGG